MKWYDIPLLAVNICCFFIFIYWTVKAKTGGQTLLFAAMALLTCIMMLCGFADLAYHVQN